MEAQTSLFKKVILIIAFFLLNFSILCGGNFQLLGPFSLRHIAMLVLFVVAFLNRTRISSKHFMLPMYLIYLGVYTICNIINSEVSTHSFLQSLYTYHAPCIALIVGLPAILKNKEQVHFFELSLACLYMFDVVLTLLQYMNNGLAWVIATRISSSAEDGMASAEMYAEASGSLFGYSLVAGAFGFVVTNGYFLATYLPVLTNRINTNKFRDVLISIILLGIGSVAIFVTQQRMAFISLLLYLCYFVYYGMSKGYRIPIVIIAIIFSLLYLDPATIHMGRLTTDTNNDTRMRLFDDFFKFLDSDQWAFGGAVHYLNTYHKAQHNTFLSAWVLGGIFTFVTYLILYYKLLKSCISTLKPLRLFRQYYPLTLSCAIASAIFLIYSITHSAGVQSGSPLFWVVYVLMKISYCFESEEQR